MRARAPPPPPYSRAPAIIRLIRQTGARKLHIKRDGAGGGEPAWATILCSPEAWPGLVPLADAHEAGGGGATPARPLGGWLARALIIGPLRARLRAERRAALTAADSQPKNRGSVAVSKRVEAEGEAVAGGRAAHGAALAPFIAKVVTAMCEAPPRYASWRNRAPSTVEQRRLLPFPQVRYCAVPPLAMPRVPPPVPLDVVFAGPPAGLIRIEWLCYPGVYDAVPAFMSLCDRAWEDIADGRQPRRISDLVITPDMMPPWARGVGFNSEDPEDCIPTLRSDRLTQFPGDRQLDRRAYRALCVETGWYDIDPDICEQAGEGGIEIRSQCEWSTTLSFHHKGVTEGINAAQEIVDVELAERWALECGRHPPRWPYKATPRDVIWQEKQRILAGGELESWMKPRGTFNLSHDSATAKNDSVNGGVPSEEKALHLPGVRDHGRAGAIADAACFIRTAGGRLKRDLLSGLDEAGRAAALRALSWGVDISSAYCLAVLQALDQWMQGYVWRSAKNPRRACFMLTLRMFFGGAPFPQKFTRLLGPVIEAVRRDHVAFDLANPPPECVRAWVREREAAGVHTDGPISRQGYIDDLNGSALNYRVSPPTHVPEVDLGAEALRAVGGTPAHCDTQAAAHTRLAIARLESVGLGVAKPKTSVGDGVISLGLQSWIERGLLRCPGLKRASIVGACKALRDATVAGEELETLRLMKLTGRLGNTSEIMPELLSVLHAGYRVSTPSRKRPDGTRKILSHIRLRSGGRAEEGLLDLLELAIDVLEKNEGIPLAARLDFPRMEEKGVLTVQTDASGEDGFGGYAFSPSDPGVIWLLSEFWPADVQAALTAAAATRAERERIGEGMEARFAMPAAELFCCYAMPQAAAASTRPPAPFNAVVSIGDCGPAANALNRGSSGSEQLRGLLAEARSVSEQWLGVSIPREANLDPDVLSHPARVGEVIDAAAAAGLTVRRVRVTERAWVNLRKAMWLPMGSAAHDAPDDGLE